MNRPSVYIVERCEHYEDTILSGIFYNVENAINYARDSVMELLEEEGVLEEETTPNDDFIYFASVKGSFLNPRYVVSEVMVKDWEKVK